MKSLPGNEGKTGLKFTFYSFFVKLKVNIAIICSGGKER